MSKQNLPDPGEGWRLLYETEVTKDGDQYKRGGKEWVEITDPGLRFSNRYLWPHRRRIPTDSPQPATSRDTEEQVCDDIKARQRLGVAKYGTTVADNPLSLRAW
jgi:hypothetical protein